MIQYLFAKFLKKARGRAISSSNIHSTSKVEAGSEFINSTMGRYSFCGYDCDINSCDIGSFTSIANGVVIGGGMHPMDWVGMSPVFYSGRDSVKEKFSNYERQEIKRTKIGNDVWIGRNVLIKQGVTIGHGSVIGMGSVVTKDVAPYSIVGGVPAKEINKRFDENIVSQLLESNWWDLPEEELRKVAVYIKDPIQFINRLNSQ